MEVAAALGSLFQPLSWLLVHFLAEVCSTRHPGPSFAISGNPDRPFSPQGERPGALLWKHLYSSPFCSFGFSAARAALMATGGNHVLQLPCLWNESWEVSYISSQGHGHLEHCLLQLLAAA